MANQLKYRLLELGWPYRRIDRERGYEAQADLGSGAWIVENGRKRKAFECYPIK